MTFLIKLLKKTQNNVPYIVKYSELRVKEEKSLADN